MYREDGTLVPSTQMAAAGVSDEYVVLLPKWIDITEIDGRGGITFTPGPGSRPRRVPPHGVIDMFGHLELDTAAEHSIREQRSRLRRRRWLVCRCGERFADDVTAAVHQIGRHGEIRVIARYNTGGLLEPLIAEFVRLVCAMGLVLIPDSIDIVSTTTHIGV